MHLRSLEQAPIADEYLKALQHDESHRGDIGHVGSSKITIALLLKKGPEDYSRTDEDMLFSIHGPRQSPFFISGWAAGRVEEQLRGHGGDLHFYNLHNAITYVGTHDSEVLPPYRYRLRLGSGQLSRGWLGVCNQCRRLMIGAEPSLN